MDTLGGQALIEGVLIQHGESVSVAIRKPNGKIITKKEKVPLKPSKIPFVRGVINLMVMLYVGMKMLTFSSRLRSRKSRSQSRERRVR